jgi:hypothetical protein
VRESTASRVAARHRRLRVALYAALALMMWPLGAHAQDRFEIQVYDSQIAPPGGVGLEVHVNHVAAGTHDVENGEAPTDRQTHLTFEPHLGLTPWCELGAYFQAGFDADGTARWAGFKGRFKARLPRRYARDIIGLAVNLELSDVPARYESNVLGSEIRPVIDFAWRRLYASINPILDIDLEGKLAGRPQLQPAAKVAITAMPNLAFGLEYYSAFGAVTGFSPLSQQTHQLYAVVDVAHVISPKLAVDVNFGAGYNLADNGDRWVVKAIVGIGR